MTRKRTNGAAFAIVGVGASAGGLEAFQQLLGALPVDTGLGFVLIQHLDPDHESALVQILARATALPVRQISDGMRVEANHVYVIPRDSDLRIADGVLELQPRPKTRRPHRPIDTFFESLAEDQGERAVGVVLSGTASDGTQGLEAIKAEAGITFAQDDSAKHDSMPRSAVAAGCVDLVLSPVGIARELARIAKHPLRAPAAGAKSVLGDAPVDDYSRILDLLREHSGVDFSLYRSTTIQRRINRRLVLSRRDTLDDYAGFLRGNASELEALYADVLISVTSFFRNPETYEVIEQKVLPTLLVARRTEPMRFWVLGCSTGQEAYSLAMLFAEVAERAPRAPRLQIFATDLNDALLEKARHGLYARNLVDGLSPQRLRRFFVEEEGGYRVNKALREMVVFARHNLISDPPFSRMDLVSCRNLLIYLEPTLQQKAIPTFHHALKTGGFLLLGASESVAGFPQLFEPLDKKHKVYARKPGASQAHRIGFAAEPAEPTAGRRAFLPLPPIGGAGDDARAEQNAQREADRITVTQFAPPGVLVNADLQVVQFRGATGAFLEPPVGKASFDLLKMARDGLTLPLRSAISQAKKENKTTRKENVRVEDNGTSRTVNLEVVPLKNLSERCFLVLFEEATPPKGKRPAPPARPAPRQVSQLEAELADTREYLRSTQEQQEAAIEELQAANEEVQSTNEELQSLNEELETSKEELESANEELITLNEEMSNRNVELHRLNDDLVNLQTSARLPIVLIGRDLTIRRFSQQAEKQLELSVTDLGRPIGHLRPRLVEVRFEGGSPHDVPIDLEALVTTVIADVREQVREVIDGDRRWRSLVVRPYLTLDNKVDGAVLVLIDIDALKRAELAIGAARDYAENMVDTVREPLVVLDRNLRVESANRSFYRTFKVTAAETIGTPLYDLGNRQWDQPRLRSLLEDILARDTSIEDYEVEHDFAHLGRRTMLLNARRIQEPQHGRPRILVAIEDITERKRIDELRRTSVALSAADQRKNEFLAMLGHELRNPLSALTLGLQLLDQVGDDQARSHDLRDRMLTQAQRIGHLLDQLLDVSRIASGKIELTRAAVDLVDVVQAAIDTVRPLVERRGHELVTRVPPRKHAMVMGDSTRLTQVVDNLLTNAAKYTNEGGRIWLTLEESDRSVRLVVRDNGIGMSGELLPHVFELFTQAPRTLDRAEGGLGLGLSLVKRLVELHGGEVAASSGGSDQGSEFVVTLPRLVEAQPARRGPEPAAVERAAALRVLIVDDEDDPAQALATLLELQGHSTRVVHDGEEALEAVLSFAPDAVLLDLGLPGMDGYEVCRRIRDEHGDRKLRMIAVTGYQKDPVRLSEAGFDEHVLKPPDIGKLSALLEIRN